MKKTFRSRTKAEEKEDNKIMDYIETQLKEVRFRLKLYLGNGGQENYNENRLFFSIKRIDGVVAALQSYLFDGEIAEIALDSAKAHWPLKTE